jgi:gentisate 1,2-dioxygenase
MNPKDDQSGEMIAPASQVHAYASTKIQKESYSFHEQPYFKMPSWQKMTVAVSRT